MKLLNSKSILDCDEFEEEIHNKETQEILEGLLNILIMTVQQSLSILMKQIKIKSQLLSNVNYIVVMK